MISSIYTPSSTHTHPVEIVDLQLDLSLSINSQKKLMGTPLNNIRNAYNVIRLIVMVPMSVLCVYVQLTREYVFFKTSNPIGGVVYG